MQSMRTWGLKSDEKITFPNPTPPYPTPDPTLPDSTPLFPAPPYLTPPHPQPAPPSATVTLPCPTLPHSTPTQVVTKKMQDPDMFLWCHLDFRQDRDWIASVKEKRNPHGPFQSQDILLSFFNDISH